MDAEPYVIVHLPSRDEAEADTMVAARLAAETLIKDHDYSGHCTIMKGLTTWGSFKSGRDYAIGGWWKTPEEER